MEEDAPANAVGGGNIAGVGVGPKGEPGRPAMTMIRRKRLKQFIRDNIKEQGPGKSWCPICGESDCPKVYYKALGKYVCAGKSSSSKGGDGDGE
jgi:hypothetical protein